MTEDIKTIYAHANRNRAKAAQTKSAYQEMMKGILVGEFCGNKTYLVYEGKEWHCKEYGVYAGRLMCVGCRTLDEVLAQFSENCNFSTKYGQVMLKIKETGQGAKPEGVAKTRFDALAKTVSTYFA